MAISTSNFDNLIQGDRVLTHEGMATILYRAEDGSYVMDLDSCGPNGYAFTLNETMAMFARIGVPLSMIKSGRDFCITEDPFSGFTSEYDEITDRISGSSVEIQDVNMTGFTCEYGDGETFVFTWESDSGQSVEERLSILFDLDFIDNLCWEPLERTVHPVHGHADAHPSMETLSAGHRFNDGVHRRPKFYSVIFVSEDGVLVENVDTKELETIMPDELVNYFQSVQPSQMVQGAIIYRRPSWSDPSGIIRQKIESVTDGTIHYTADSDLYQTDTLSNMTCPLEERNMYFYV